MSELPHKPIGFLNLTLHAHLPYVLNHGTWPHGTEWLLEAAAETYLPLLRVFAGLERDGIDFPVTLNLTPVLLEQLADPVFLAEFPHYLERKRAAGLEDEAYFGHSGEQGYAAMARFWQRFYAEAAEQFAALGQSIVGGFRALADRGRLEIITCAASHGYLPLLGNDECVRAQVRTAVRAHERHLGEAPRGIWSPECGYRPAGPWQFPVPLPGDEAAAPPVHRIGLEQVFAESNLRFFTVDTHLIEGTGRTVSPYEHAPTPPPDESAAALPGAVYRPHFVETDAPRHDAVAVFARDPRTGLQVWSGDHGYPGDGEYLDFHKKRWPGGHRYWRVTGPHADLADKQPYDGHCAAERLREHASHFVHTVWSALESHEEGAAPPVLTAPFDAELFGHWWFEGPQFLDAVARVLHEYDTGVAVATASGYLAAFPPTDTVRLPEGSWGAGGRDAVWLNDETSWTYAALYPAELFCVEVCTDNLWREDATAGRVARQLCRELLLLESSDWPFLITTGAARDYAEARFRTHLDSFNQLRACWERLAAGHPLTDTEAAGLAELEHRDSLFADLDPAWWARGASASHSAPTHADPTPVQPAPVQPAPDQPAPTRATPHAPAAGQALP